MAQIGGYLTPQDHRRFKIYASTFHVAESALLTLLIMREVRCGRLGDLVPHYSYAGPLRERSRVTARIKEAGLKQKFGELACVANISPDQAVTVLMRAELAEKWLDHAVELNKNILEST